MLRHLKNLIKGEKSAAIAVISIDNDVNTPSYLLNYECFSLAWNEQHKGCFIDPFNGCLIEYHNPKDWIFFSSSEEYSTNVFWGYEKDGTIKRSDLFQNINNSKKSNIESGRIDVNIDEMLHDLIETGFDETLGGYDMGITSYSILIYDSINDEYRRNILKTEGDKHITSRSSFAPELLNYFGNHIITE